jgi:hypothetical protein
MHYHFSVDDLVENRVGKPWHGKRAMEAPQSLSMNTCRPLQRANFSLKVPQEVVSRTSFLSFVKFGAIRQIPFS